MNFRRHSGDKNRFANSLRDGGWHCSDHRPPLFRPQTVQQGKIHSAQALRQCWSPTAHSLRQWNRSAAACSNSPQRPLLNLKTTSHTWNTPERIFFFNTRGLVEKRNSFLTRVCVDLYARRHSVGCAAGAVTQLRPIQRATLFEAAEQLHRSHRRRSQRLFQSRCNFRQQTACNNFQAHVHCKCFYYLFIDWVTAGGVLNFSHFYDFYLGKLK